AHYTVGKLDQFTGHTIVQPVSPSNTVTNFNDGSDVTDFHLCVKILNLLLNQRTDFFSLDAHTISPLSSLVCRSNVPFDSFQFSTDGPVIDGIPDTELNTANNGWVHLIFKLNRLFIKSLCIHLTDFIQFLLR